MTKKGNDSVRTRSSAPSIDRGGSSISSAKPKDKPYTMTDGGGLHLLVNPNGSKLWRFRYTFNGKQKQIGLGSFPDTPLVKARMMREKLHQQIAEGIDPSAQRKAERVEHQADTLTFRVVAERWYKGNAELAAKPWAPATARKVRIYLEKDFYPTIGSKPVADITRMELIAINETMEKRGAFDASKKAREWLAAIFDDALDRGEIPHNPAHRLKSGHRAKGVTTRPNPNVGFEGLPALLKAVNDSGNHLVVKLAVKMLVLTAVRPGELRGASWSEFDLESATWHIPAERMKMRRTHSVPLPKQVLEILEQLKVINPDGCLFVLRGDKPFSEMTINVALRRLGYGGKQTGHGFRHLLSTELHQRGYNSDWVEAQLAHKIEGIRGVYNQADYLEQRRKMMQEWADSIDAAMSGSCVVAINRQWVAV